MADSPERRALCRGKDYWNRLRKRREERDWGDGEFIAYLEGVRLTGRSLRGYDFSNVDFDGASLRRTDLSGSTFTEASLRQAHLEGANLSKCDLYSVDATNADFRGVDLTDACLSYADLTGADLRNARLVNANLTWAILRDSDLRHADLSGARLVCTILENADIKNARLDKVELTTRHNEDPALGQFLELAACKNLETVRVNDSQVITDYLSEAFEYVHRPNLEVAKECPDFFSQALERITALNRLSSFGLPPSGLIDVVHLITEELIKYLRSHPRALYEIRPRQFEELIAEILKSFGWVVELTPETRDGGYDLFGVCRDISGVESKWIIECKKYAATRKVGVDIVRSLYGVKPVQRGANALLATTSFFSSDAIKYKASRYDLQLRDFNGVVEWVNQYKPSRGNRILVRDKPIIIPKGE